MQRTWIQNNVQAEDWKVGGFVLSGTRGFRSAPLIPLSDSFLLSILNNTTTYTGLHFRNDMVFLIFYI